MIWVVFGAMAVATLLAVWQIVANADRARTSKQLRFAAGSVWFVGLVSSLAGKPLIGLTLMALGAFGLFLAPRKSVRGSVGSERNRHGRAASGGPHVERDADPRAGGRRAAPGVMTEQQAYQILGLQPGARLEEVVRAHRALMKELHPDHGGPTELAAQVNAAKDFLTKRGHG